MKLTIVLLAMGFLTVNAKVIAQNVTFSGENVALEKIFTEIKKQTGYGVTYKETILNGIGPVSIKAHNLPLKDFLDLIFKDQPIKFVLSYKTILLTREANVKHTLEILLLPGSVRGRVINESGEPLAGVTIKVNTIYLAATTDEKGYYRIENIVPGEYKLVVSYVGYAIRTIAIKVTESGSTVQDVTLTPSLVNLDQLTVTSTLSARKIREYPGTIAEIKQEDLKNRNINNISSVLDGIPGILITPGTEGFNSDNTRQPYGLLIRGTSAGGIPIKYLLDGVEIVAEESQSILQTIDPNNIEKIEVLKGPMASTLYGSGAASGIISITTKKGKSAKSRVNFKTMYTQFANDYADYSGYNQNYSLNISGGNEKLNYLVGAGYNLYPATKLSDTSNGINDRTLSFNARVGGKINKIAADLSVQYGEEKSGTGSTAASFNKYRASLGISTVPETAFQDRRNNQRNFLTSLHLTHTLRDNWYQDLTIGYNITNQMSNSYTKAYDGTYTNSENLYSKLNARYFMFYDHSWSSILKTSITAGFEYNGYEKRLMNLNSVKPLTNFYSSPTGATAGAASFQRSPYSSTGYFAEAVTGLKNDLFLTTGIRYDVNPAYGEGVGAYAQPRVGLSYVIAAGRFKMKPRAVWGVSSLAPDPTYKIGSFTPSAWGNDVVIPNPDIKPQRSEGYEFGADVFYGSNYSLNVTYYDQKIKDMIMPLYTSDYTTNPATYNTYYRNIAKAINKGIEISAKAVLTPFTIDLSYTQTKSKWGSETGQTANTLVYGGAPNLDVPKRSVFAKATYKIPSVFIWTKRGGSVSLDWKYNGSSFSFDQISYSLDGDKWNALPNPKPPYPNYNSYFLWQKGYHYFNLRTDYSLSNFAALYVDVQNLLDKQGSVNGQNYNRFPGRRINFGFNLNF